MKHDLHPRDWGISSVGALDAIQDLIERTMFSISLIFLNTLAYSTGQQVAHLSLALTKTSIVRCYQRWLQHPVPIMITHYELRPDPVHARGTDTSAATRLAYA
jgi:hypothetical protein